MKPNEFWNCTYREINTYVQSNLYRSIDDFRQNIRLQEAATDKLIMADAMSNRKPKIIPIRTTFKQLFPEQEFKVQSPNEITRRMRQIMKLDKKI